MWPISRNEMYNVGGLVYDQRPAKEKRAEKNIEKGKK